MGKIDIDDEPEYPPGFEEEQDMTVGVGFRCKDGILIAGDRQRTRGESARSVIKVQEFSHREGFSGVFIGAGPSSCVDMMFSDIDSSLHDSMPLKKITRAIDEENGRVYRKHVELPARAKKRDPRFSLLVGLWSRQEGCKLIVAKSDVRIPGQGGRDSEIIPVSIPKLIRSRFRDEAGHGFRF